MSGNIFEEMTLLEASNCALTDVGFITPEKCPYPEGLIALLRGICVSRSLCMLDWPSQSYHSRRRSRSVNFEAFLGDLETFSVKYRIVEEI